MKLARLPIASLCFTALVLEPSTARTGEVFQQTPAPGLSPEDPEPVPPPPNILVIVLDDVGIDKLSLYRRTQAPFAPPSACAPLANPFSYPPTPNLRRIAEGQIHPDHGGIQFLNAYANPLCSPTRAGLMTGRYAVRTGIGLATANSNNSLNGQCPPTLGYPPPCYVDQTTLSDAEMFLPELLKTGFQGGPFASGAFGKWHLTTVDDYDHALRNGFDVFQGQMQNVRNHWSYQYVNSNASPMVSPINITVGACPADFQNIFPNGYVFDENEWSASKATQDALAWIDAQQDPFFAYVSYNPPHAPYQVPPQTRVLPTTWAALESSCLEPDVCPLPPDPCPDPPGLQPGEMSENESEAKLFYRAMIEAVDWEIGLLVDGIDPDKLANTMVFVIGDNGTPSTVMDQSRHEETHGKSTVYEWGTHVPLLVSGPLVPHETTRAHTCSGLVGAVDLFPTVAAIAGASVAAAGPLDGVSFLPLIANPTAASNRTYAFSQAFSSPRCLQPLCAPAPCPPGLINCPPNLPYTPTMAGPYATGLGPLGEVPPNPACQMLELTTHARSVTNGTYRYVRIQECTPVDGGHGGAPDTPPTYKEEFYRLVNVSIGGTPYPGDPEEQTNLFHDPLDPNPPDPLFLHPSELAIIDAMRQHMFAVSGW